MQATMSHAPRQLTASNKTKASENNKTFDFLKPSTTPKLAKPVKPIIPRAAPPIKPARPPSDSKLMAGYLAHEYLTKGTLFGQPWDPARADVVPGSGAAHLADLRKPMKQSVVSQKGKPAEQKPGDKRKFESYAQVSGILMGKNGAHIPGIVNPTQLTRFLNLQ